jgi:hypothetical protein
LRLKRSKEEMCDSFSCKQFCSGFPPGGHKMPTGMYQMCIEKCGKGQCRDFCSQFDGRTDQHVCRRGCDYACSRKIVVNKRLKGGQIGKVPRKPIKGFHRDQRLSASECPLKKIVIISLLIAGGVLLYKKMKKK